MAKTREEYLQAKRNWAAKRRAEDPERIRRLQNLGYHLNREHRKEIMRKYYRRRFFWGRTTHLKGEGKATTKELSSLWRKQRGRCAYTGIKLDRTAHLDHKVPRCRGGGDNIDNLQWVTEEANFAKRDLTHNEFHNLCKAVVETLQKEQHEQEVLQKAA